MIQATKEHWQTICRSIGQTNTLAKTEEVYEWLVAQYTQKDRHYHNLNHIDHCLVELDQVRGLVADPIALELAIWFHDCVYDTHAHDNEEKSAQASNRWLSQLGASKELLAQVERFIQATDYRTAVPDGDACYLVDIDLAILGQPEKQFDHYEYAIHQEFSWVPKEAYRRRRAQVLGSFLKQKQIYRTSHFSSLYEKQAKRNLSRSAMRLNRPETPQP